MCQREEAQKLLDDIKSMSVADIDRERLVNAYLDALIRVVEPAEKAQDCGNAEPDQSIQGDAGARFGVGMAGGSREG